MKRRLAILAANRQRLSEKIESQRMEVAAIARRWQTPVALADLGLGALHLIRNHPLLVSGGAAALLALRRKGIVGMAREWWPLLKSYSSPFSFVLKFVSSATRSQGDERDASVDH